MDPSPGIPRLSRGAQGAGLLACADPCFPYLRKVISLPERAVIETGLRKNAQRRTIEAQISKAHGRATKRRPPGGLFRIGLAPVQFLHSTLPIFRTTSVMVLASASQ